jgi:hypothetical protein
MCDAVQSQCIALLTDMKKPIHTEKSNKMQQCIKIILFYIYMKLDMFRTTHRPSSGAVSVQQPHVQQTSTVLCKPDAASAVLGS